MRRVAGAILAYALIVGLVALGVGTFVSVWAEMVFVVLAPIAGLLVGYEAYDRWG